MRHTLALLIALFALPCPPAAAAPGEDFWKHWGDGKAEMNGYTLIQPRYNENREGTAILVFVTEDFSDSARVKADPGRHPPSDVYPVLKLNAVRDFQTGIYDYNVMTSVFARTESSFAVTKISFSSQEWCGHVYQQWLAKDGKLVGDAHSYFDGEADAQLSLDLLPGGVAEDALPILLRNLRGDLVAPGASRTVPFLPSTLRARLGHKRQAWGEATIRRSAAAAPVATALGTLRAFTYTVEEKGGETTTWTIEDAYPHRVLAWQSSSGEAARITGSTRLPYWQLNRRGDESHLKSMGLEPPATSRRRAATAPSSRP